MTKQETVSGVIVELSEPDKDGWRTSMIHGEHYVWNPGGICFYMHSKHITPQHDLKPEEPEHGYIVVNLTSKSIAGTFPREFLTKRVAIERLTDFQANYPDQKYVIRRISLEAKDDD